MTTRYRHRRTSTAATPFPSPVEPGEIVVNTANRQLVVGDAASATLGQPILLLAVRFFDTRAAYAVNDVVLYNGTIYRCVTPTGPGAFIPARWATPTVDTTTLVQKAGDTMTGELILPGDPADPLGAATKQYVDAGDAAGKAYTDAAIGAMPPPPPSLLISDTPPVGAPDKALWWESDSGLLYVRYNDGTSTQWVIACPQPDIGALAPLVSPNFTGNPTAPTPAAGDNDTSIATTAFVQSAIASPTNGVVHYDAAQTLAASQAQQARQNIYAAPFDALAYSGLQVNGSFDVAQIGTPTNNGYFCDNWKVTGVGTAVVTASQAATGLFPGLPNFCNVTVSTAQAAMAAGDYQVIYQSIEGYRIARLAWGTAAAQPLTIAFWTAHHRPGIYTGTVKNGGANDSCSFTYTQAVADTPQYNVVTIPGPTSQTWETTNTSGLSITFALACGTTYSTAGNGIWQVGGNYLAGPGQVNAVASTADVFRLSGVIMLPGSEAPSSVRQSFIMRPYDQEVTLCKRYCNIYRNLVMSGSMLNGSWVYITYAFPEMRAVPTASFSNITNTSSSGPAVASASLNNLYLSMQNYGSAAFYSTFDMALDARF